MKRTFSIRRYRDADLNRCRGFWRELVECHRELYSDVSIGGEAPELYFDKQLAKVGVNRVWVAVSEDIVVGFMGLEINEEEATIEPLIISKACRGKGAGRMLVEKAVDEAQKNGVKFLSVMPVVRNEKAIQFFYEMGFMNIGRVQLFIDFSGKKWKSGLKLCRMEFDF